MKLKLNKGQIYTYEVNGIEYTGVYIDTILNPYENRYCYVFLDGTTEHKPLCSEVYLSVEVLYA